MNSVEIFSIPKLSVPQAPPPAGTSHGLSSRAVGAAATLGTKQHNEGLNFGVKQDTSFVLLPLQFKDRVLPTRQPLPREAPEAQPWLCALRNSAEKRLPLDLKPEVRRIRCFEVLVCM
jgi:hypothetical protein